MFSVTLLSVSTKTAATRPDERRILDAVRNLVREIRLTSTATHHGEQISAAQAFVLQTLLVSPGLRINDLADQTSTDQSSVSVVVQKLADSGLVVKARSHADKRAYEVHLTAAGRSLAKKTPVAPQLRLLAGMRKMRPADRRTLATLLEQWLLALGVVDTAPPMLGEESTRPAAKRRSR